MSAPSGSHSHGHTSIGTGMELQQQVSLTWGIDNVPIVLKQEALINSQTIDFNCGDDNSGNQSKWTVGLEVDNFSFTKRIRFNYTLKEKPATLGDDWCSQMQFAIRSNSHLDGKPIWKGKSTVNFCTLTSDVGWATDLISVGDLLRKGSHRLEVHITLKLYSPKEPTVQVDAGDVQHSLEQLSAVSTPKARKALLAGLLLGADDPISGEVKIISCDGAEFSAPKGVLAARSPFFDSMFRTDMTEANEGIIKLPDISEVTLRVLLGFIYSGELLPEWKGSGVIVELTNAAAKYQLVELLEFLDSVLGKVCDLENVAPLLTLASQLSLKTAEKELLKFISEEGASSAQNFFQIMKAIVGMNVANTIM